MKKLLLATLSPMMILVIAPSARLVMAQQNGDDSGDSYYVDSDLNQPSDMPIDDQTDQNFSTNPATGPATQLKLNDGIFSFFTPVLGDIPTADYDESYQPDNQANHFNQIDQLPRPGGSDKGDYSHAGDYQNYKLTDQEKIAQSTWQNAFSDFTNQGKTTQEAQQAADAAAAKAYNEAGGQYNEFFKGSSFNQDLPRKNDFVPSGGGEYVMSAGGHGDTFQSPADYFNSSRFQGFSPEEQGRQQQTYQDYQNNPGQYQQYQQPTGGMTMPTMPMPTMPTSRGLLQKFLANLLDLLSL